MAKTDWARPVASYLFKATMGRHLKGNQRLLNGMCSRNQLPYSCIRDGLANSPLPRSAAVAAGKGQGPGSGQQRAREGQPADERVVDERDDSPSDPPHRMSPTGRPHPNPTGTTNAPPPPPETCATALSASRSSTNTLGWRGHIPVLGLAASYVAGAWTLALLRPRCWAGARAAPPAAGCGAVVGEGLLLALLGHWLSGVKLRGAGDSGPDWGLARFDQETEEAQGKGMPCPGRAPASGLGLPEGEPLEVRRSCGSADGEPVVGLVPLG